MLPAHQGGGSGASDGGSWRRPLGRRGPQAHHYHQQQQHHHHHHHEAGGGQCYAPTDPHRPPHDDGGRSHSPSRRGVPYGRRKSQARQAALWVLLPLLMFAVVLYKRSGGGGRGGGDGAVLGGQGGRRPQSLAVGGAAQGQATAKRPPPVKLRLSTFGKNETSKGEVAQVWITLANEEEGVDAEAAVNAALQVYLPHPSLKFQAGSAFPTLEPPSGADPAPTVHDDVDLWEDGRRFTLVRFPGAPLAPGKSRVYNLEARVEGFLEGDGEGVLRAYAQAFVEGAAEGKGVAGGSNGGGVRPLASLTVTLGKKHVVTNDDLARQRAAKAEELEKKGVGVGLRWKPFSDCRPYSPLAAAMTTCFAVCHPKGPDACLACGYDEAAKACICKTPGGGVEEVAIDPPALPVGVAGYVVDEEEDEEEEEEEEEGEEEKDEEKTKGKRKRKPFVFPFGRSPPPRGKKALTSAAGGRERIAEVLVFPGLIPEADCARMDAYLDELVAREATVRKIIAEDDSPLHALLTGAVRAVMPDAGVEYLEWVTLAREDVEVSPHYDSVKGEETHKVLLFLDGTAGTRFWETQAAWRAGICPMTLPAARGTVVVFPMALYHDSMAFVPQGALKSTLGLRAILPPFEGGDTLGLVKAPAAGAAATA